MFPSIKDHKLYGSAIVNAKWQLVIPSEARKDLGISPGDQLIIVSKWKHFLGCIKAANVQEFIDTVLHQLEKMSESVR